MTEQVSAEAVEAAARARSQAQNPDYPLTDAAWGALRSRVEVEWMRAALTAALPYLAQPARVVPSVEDIEQVQREHLLTSVTRDHRAVAACSCGLVYDNTGAVPPNGGVHARHVAERVLALFASQPPVAGETTGGK